MRASIQQVRSALPVTPGTKLKNNQQRQRYSCCHGKRRYGNECVTHAFPSARLSDFPRQLRGDGRLSTTAIASASATDLQVRIMVMAQ